MKRALAAVVVAGLWAVLKAIELLEGDLHDWKGDA